MPSIDFLSQLLAFDLPWRSRKHRFFGDVANKMSLHSIATRPKGWAAIGNQDVVGPETGIATMFRVGPRVVRHCSPLMCFAAASRRPLRDRGADDLFRGRVSRSSERPCQRRDECAPFVGPSDLSRYPQPPQVSAALQSSGTFHFVLRTK